MKASYLFAALLYFLFVVYGSLVPLDYRPLPFAEAVTRFQQIRSLNLGIASRADWVANILLYIPLAFFGLAAMDGIRNALLRRTAAAFVVLFCLTTAVAVEFVQLYFPPRTVSINDLVAETMGIGLGFLGWRLFGRQFIALSQQLALRNGLSAQAAIIFYLSVYFILNVFPFDFVTSLAEFTEKLASGSVGLFIAPNTIEDSFRLTLKILAEITVLMPLGALISWLPSIRHPLLLSVLAGFLLGTLIEGLQLFIYSSVAQGFSIITRMLGMGLGALSSIWLKKQTVSDWQGYFAPVAAIAVAPYVLLVMTINGWFNGTWLPMDTVAAKLSETQFLPFYYFYYTTETRAMASLLSNLAAYFPVGCLVWLGFLDYPDIRKPHWLAVGSLATVLALIIETGKLFLAEQHADPTDLLIAFTAGACAYAVLHQWQQQGKVHQTDGDLAIGTLSLSPGPLVPVERDDLREMAKKSTKTNQKMVFLSVIVLMLVTVSVSGYPLISLELGLFLAGYAYLLWRYPQSWLLVLPASLPLLDFAPYTGRFFFDEFDFLVLVTVAIAYLRPYKPLLQPHNRLFKKRIWLLLGFFGLSYLTSLLIGLLPLAPLDANAFNHYYSHYNALRVAKGVAWAFLLLPLLRRQLQQYSNAIPLFSIGMLLGLAAMSCFAVVERWVFPGLTDFSFDYRISALFSTMHTGGGHIESYLSLAMPFIATLWFNLRPVGIRITLAFIVFALSLYALLMTFSRGGYIGLGIGLLVLLLALLYSFKGQLLKARRPYLMAIPLLALIPLLVLPVFQGDTIKQRFDVAGRDKNTRMAHWQDAVGMMDHGFTTLLFGMGLGSFPRTFFWLNNEGSQPASYLIENTGINPYLRLRGGDALYFGQYIQIKPHAAYQLTMDLRSADENQRLSIMICEKSLQYSFRCQSTVKSTHGPDWHTIQQSIDSGELAAAAPDIANGWFTRPVQLALQNISADGKIIDVDNIQLLDNEGKNLIRNGGFSHATDHWFFATEKHNPWHIFNLWVDVLFSTGWLGLISLAWLVLATFFQLARNLDNNPFAAVLLSALSGFFIVGLVDSPFDAPRLTFLFFLLLFMGLGKARYYQDHPKVTRPAKAFESPNPVL